MSIYQFKYKSYQYLDYMRKNNRRRFRADGESAQLTLNVDTSLPFTMKSPVLPLFSTTQQPNKKIDYCHQNILDHTQLHRNECWNQNKQLHLSGQYAQQLNTNYQHKDSIIRSSQIYQIPHHFIQQPQQLQRQQDNFYLTRDEQLYFRYKKQQLDQNEVRKQLQNNQYYHRKYNEQQMIKLQEDLTIIPKMSFLKAFLQKIMNKLQGKESIQTKPHVQGILQKIKPKPKEQRSQFQHKFKSKIEEKIPPIFIFQPLYKKKNAHNNQNPIFRRKVYRNYNIKYQVQKIRYDTQKTVQIIEGDLNAGQINPFLNKTMQFVINFIVKKIKGTIKSIVQHIQIKQFQKEGKVILKLSCIVRPLVFEKFQCTFTNFSKNCVKGLRLYTPNVQVSFNTPIKINEVNLKNSIQIDNYCIKLKNNLDRNISLTFRNLSLNSNTRDQFIKFFEDNCFELSQNFIDFLYDKYINIGAVSI